MAPGVHLVWLDQMRLVHSNRDWKLEFLIAIDRSTNYGFRSTIVYRKLCAAPSLAAAAPKCPAISRSYRSVARARNGLPLFPNTS